MKFWNISYVVGENKAVFWLECMLFVLHFFEVLIITLINIRIESYLLRREIISFCFKDLYHFCVVDKLVCFFVTKHYCQFEVDTCVELEPLKLESIERSLNVVSLEIIDNRPNKNYEWDNNKYYGSNQSKGWACFTC